MHEGNKSNTRCVEVNIFVKCKDGSWRKERENPCAVVNVEIDCDECERRRHDCDEH